MHLSFLPSRRLIYSASNSMNDELGCTEQTAADYTVDTWECFVFLSAFICPICMLDSILIYVFSCSKLTLLTASGHLGKRREKM